MFETNLRDDRYLPFEGTGVAGSQWRLTLPSDVKQFDFDTITDVVVHVRYTAREGGDLLKASAVKNLQSQISKANTIGSACFSLFATIFHRNGPNFKALQNWQLH